MLKEIVKIIFISLFLGTTVFFSRKTEDLIKLFKFSKNADIKIEQLPSIRYFQIIELPQVLKFKQNQSNTFIDVRERRRFKYGRIPGAINIPLKDIESLSGDELEKLRRSPNVILYCLGESCDLSELAAVELYRKGLRNLNVYSAGWSEWKSCALPVEGSDK